MRIPALMAKDPREKQGAERSKVSHISTTSLRPPLLLAIPEPITVLAEVPEGAPARFTWRRVTHTVVKAEGPERIEPEWWRMLGPLARPPGPRDLPTRMIAAGCTGFREPYDHAQAAAGLVHARIVG